MLRHIFFGGLFFSTACVCGLMALPADTAKPVRVVIVDGFSNHDWRTTTARVREILERAGGFVITVSTSPDASAPVEIMNQWFPPLGDADVVLMNCNDLGHPVHWPEGVKRALESFVANGGGMYALHSANNSFEHWPAYNRMIGLAWRSKDFGPALEIDDQGQVIRIPAGEGEKTSHGKRVDALVHRLGDHPIHRGLPREWRAADTEVYTYVRGPAENVEVISYSSDNAFRKGFPIEWVVTFGQGRVYSSSLGHLWKGDVNPAGYRCVAFQTLMVRALRWLAHREPDTAVPSDFPGSAAVSLRPESPLR